MPDQSLSFYIRWPIKQRIDDWIELKDFNNEATSR